MKNRFILMSVIVVLLTGCVSSSSEQFSQKKEIGIEQIPEQYRVHPKTPAPKGVKDGEYTGKISQGRTYKTVFKDHFADKYIDVYYPNGQLHSHTPLVDGLAQGWSEGYTAEGKLRTKVLYKDGVVVRYQTYDEQGKLLQDIQ
ncbi:toxin-antitoxin system YwqK family antitoxin [Lonepinella sp. BR2474]|uniref:toxin-antitoxin system YwqK family antitoxin n=1 Tax=Lonepinella sp. BR2474 TaxID=3434548 RepID=UPI003F6E3FBE